MNEQRDQRVDEFESAFPDDEFGGQFDYVHDDRDEDRDRPDVERDDGDDERR